MRQLFSRLVLAHGLLTVACATAIDQSGLGAPLDGDEGGSSSGGSLGSGGDGIATAGTGTSSGASGKTNGGSARGGSPGAFGGTATTGGKAASAGSNNGGDGGNAGTSSGGSGGFSGSSGGKGGSAGAASGGSNTAGSASGGGPPATVCDGVPDWTSKTYAMGDTVASTCGGAFPHGCPEGQSHKFECNPMAGVAALPWCMSREPGSGNGWWEAWVDKGQCQ